jgi:1-acyl-sn-glycerol-3-phosphate acyltransferase
MKLSLFEHSLKTVITFTIWLLIIPFLILIGVPFALLPIKYRFSELYYFCVYIGTTMMIKATFIKFRIVKGKEYLSAALEQPSIIVCNHTSAIDIPLLQMLVGHRPHIWFSKSTYARIPIFGWILRRMHILVKRESVTASAKTIEQAYVLTHGQHNHIIIFPEGKRYNDGKIHRFLGGFAVLAQALNRPVVPIVIHGLHIIFPKNNILIRSSTSKVSLSIGKPMWYTTTETRQEFTERVHNWCVNEIEQLSREV